MSSTTLLRRLEAALLVGVGEREVEGNADDRGFLDGDDGGRARGGAAKPVTVLVGEVRADAAERVGG